MTPAKHFVTPADKSQHRSVSRHMFAALFSRLEKGVLADLSSNVEERS